MHRTDLVRSTYSPRLFFFFLIGIFLSTWCNGKSCDGHTGFFPLTLTAELAGKEVEGRERVFQCFTLQERKDGVKGFVY